MEKFEPVFYLFGRFGVTKSIIVQWAIIILVAILAVYFTRDLKKIPDRKQTIIEILVATINNLVKDNMGEEYMYFVPYVGTLCIFLALMNLTGLVGISPPTTDFSVPVALALMSFVLVQGVAIKKLGVGHYLGAYVEPYAPMLPLNIMERIILPVSLSLRLFGNMTAAAVIMGLVYSALGHISVVAQFLIPVPLHFYFDLFDGAIQMVIFVMLTMINIKIMAEH